MNDNIPADSDLLLFDTIELIKAYEEGLFKRIKANPKDEMILTGYQSPLTGLESTLELSLISADTTMTDIIDSIVAKDNAFRGEHDGKEFEYKHSVYTEDGSPKEHSHKQKEPQEEIDYFYAECSLTDKNGEPTEEWWDPQQSTVKKNLNFFETDPEKIKPIEYEYRKRLSNEFKQKFGGKVTKWVQDSAGTTKIGDTTYKLDIENCLNCMIDINVELTLPSLEFVFSLTDFLRKIDRLLKQMLEDMDPSKLYDAICRFLLGFGPNVMCPANLIGINMLLPTLFAKYSLDLAKIRFDWTGLFGAMVKAILEFLIQCVEAVPKVINPFIDCIINAFKTVMNALRSIVAAGEKITNETIRTVNEFGYAIQKVVPNDWFDKESEDLKQEFDELKKDINERYKKQNEEAKKNWEKYYNQQMNLEITKFIDWVDSVSSGSKNRDEMAELLEVYLSFPGNEDLKYFLETTPESLKSNRSAEQETLKSKYEQKIKAAQKAEKIDEKKDYFRLDFVGETKTLTTPYFKKPKKADKRYNADYIEGEHGLKGDVDQIIFKDISLPKSKWNAVDVAFAKYGIDIKNEYRQPKDLINYRAKNWVKELNNTDTFKFIENYIIGYLMIAKQWINEETAKVIQTLRALQRFMGEVLESEFKVLGDMQAIAHLIRFIKLIMKFFEEGLSCENVRQNKKTMEKVIEKNNNDIVVEESSKSLKYNGKTLNPEDYIKVKSKSTNSIRIIDLSECSELDSLLNVNKDSLDSIYEGILSGLQ